MTNLASVGAIASMFLLAPHALAHAEPSGPVPTRELFGRVAPAVVAVVAGGAAAGAVPGPDGAGASPAARAAAFPAVAVPGVLVTASGYVVTSLRALAASGGDGTALAVLLGGRSGRPGAREMAAALPARLVAAAPALDLALVETLPPASVFFPHLPLARPDSPAASPATTRPGEALALAIGTTGKATKGLWATSAVTLVPAPGSGGAELRFLRAVEAAAAVELAPGAPVVDGVGRIVGLAVSPDVLLSSASGARPSGDSGPTTGPRGGVVVDVDALWRFLLAAGLPELRFAGVPPFRRSTPALLAAVARKAETARAARTRAAGGSPERERAPARPLELPKMTQKGAFDRSFARSATPTFAGTRPPATGDSLHAGVAPHAALTPAASDGAPSLASTNPVFDPAALAFSTSDLERVAVPVRWDAGAASGLPDRGPSEAPITVVQWGDYHAPDTRQVESELRALTNAGGAVRLFWADADRGAGDDYDAAAFAARAAAEQGAFWAFHDDFIDRPGAVTPARISALVRRHDLDDEAFESAFSSEGLRSQVAQQAQAAGAVPVLATPAFVVNGRLVDGGSVARHALRDAVARALSSSGPPAAAAPDGAASTPGASTAGPLPVIAAAPALPGISLSPATLTRILASAKKMGERAAQPR